MISDYAGSNTTPQRAAYAVAIYCRVENRILLIHHKLLKKWLPVGGEIETNESPLEAATRELREETGYKTSAYSWGNPDIRVDGSPHGFLGYEEHDAGPKGIHRCFSFLYFARSKLVTNNDEFDSYDWFDRDQLINGLWIHRSSPYDIPKNVRELGIRAIDTCR